jgi:mono/diheme cytochrome c family protein
VFLFLMACRSASPPPEAAHGPIPMLVEVGREGFVRHCAACHGMDGRGGGPVASALRTAPADLTRIAARRGGDFPAGEISDWIDGRLASPAHGTREMPVWGKRFAGMYGDDSVAEEVTRGKIGVLVQYLKSIQVK